MAVYVPYDVLNLVAELLYSTADKRTLITMCLVSKDWHGAAVPLLYRFIVLHLDKFWQTRSLIQQIIAKGSGMVRHIHIPSGPTATHGHQFGMLEFFLQGPLPLQTFTWEYHGPAPNQLLAIVGQIPTLQSLRLSYFLNKQNDNFPPPALKDNIKLDLLQLNIKNCELMYQCKKMILQSPGLKDLSVKIHWPNSDWDDESPNYFLFQSHEKLPPLRNLTLQRYDTGAGDLDSIANRLQVSELEELVLIRTLFDGLIIFFKTLLTRHSHLRVLKVYKCKYSNQTDEWRTCLASFLRSFKGLENLTLVNASINPDHLKEAIAHHGQSLRNLTLQSSNLYIANHDITSTLQCIRDACPNLHFLSIDLHRNDEDPSSETWMTETLRRFPALESLHIQTPLWKSRNLLLEPVVDEQYVAGLALNLRSLTLKKVVIQVGEKATITNSRVWDERVEWENWHRKKWVVTYENEFLRIQECASVEEAEALKELTDAVGVHSEPPKMWDEFKDWKQTLLHRLRNAKAKYGFCASDLASL